MAPLLPPHPPHPLRCHKLRVPDRQAIDEILFMLRIVYQWEKVTPPSLSLPAM